MSALMIILFYCLSTLCGFVFPRLFSKLNFFKTAAVAFSGMAGVWITFYFSFGVFTDALLLVIQMGALALLFASGASGIRIKAFSDRKSA